MKSKNILISGASIAGPALAYWLHQYGFDVTVVERAETLREGGQAVDFRGEAHLTMLKRMGILDDIKRHRTPPGPLILLDAHGAEQVRLPASFTGGEVEIARGDLSRLLYERTRDRVEYIFGDSIASMVETATGVDVAFEHGAPRSFDLVVGADGLHSNVRRLAFGDESQYVKSSGYYVALFSAPNHLGLHAESMLYSEPGRGMLVYGTRDGEANAMCVFAAEPLDYHRRDVATQKRIVAEAFAGMGWESAKLVAALPGAREFYFDTIGLVQMDHYTKGRVALLGDAGYGATTGGMGAGMAMISSYVLAGELAAAGGDHSVAFPQYEQQIRGYAKACQRVAAGVGPFFAPSTAKKIQRRGTIYKILASRLFVGVLNRMTTSAANHIKLKHYVGGARTGA
ncbi:FAD-dependent monooxygenase [Planotetraspora sp. A-T 1434]|uniref:FAD-dependent monooxygenase n=1 Tax=Planotetraspora sp. A-T 1434 TaxID=2979219 RepID=UPI0021C09D92|nr:FAD-dependent monooxygenase [Planotetraspora sp. A-T 1434]MCT9929622.1 FAD-dependent monooxygenase [Planotetraspora sp. A-T 1434]